MAVMIDEMQVEVVDTPSRPGAPGAPGATAGAAKPDVPHWTEALELLRERTLRLRAD